MTITHLCETKNTRGVRKRLISDLQDNDKYFDASLTYIKSHFPEVFDDYVELKDDVSDMRKYKEDKKITKISYFFNYMIISH